MKSIKVLLIALIICSCITAIIIAGAVVYMQVRGNVLLEKTLGTMLGSKVTFVSASINPSLNAVSLHGFSVVGEMGLGRDILKAERFSLVLNKDIFAKERRIVFDEVIIAGAHLDAVRETDGSFRLVYPRIVSPPHEAGAAPETAGSLYGMANNFRRISIERSSLTFTDNHVARRQVITACNDITLEIVSLKDAGPAAYIPVTLKFFCRLPNTRVGNGEVHVSADIAIYPDHTNMELAAETTNIDGMHFLPYVDGRTPFLFREAIFSSTTTFNIHNGEIDSLTTLTFRRLGFQIRQDSERYVFLKSTVRKIAPYLQTETGGIIFDFVIKGTVADPRLGFGPQVQAAMGMAVMQNVSTMVQQLKNLQW